MERKGSVLSAYKDLLYISVSALFLLVWHTYYNSRIFTTQFVYGLIGSFLIYMFLYYWFSRMYHAFMIEIYQTSEIVFSQILSFGISDLIMWLECCLLARRWVNLIPGLICVAAQIMTMIILVVLAKSYYISHVDPSPTLIVYGWEKVEEFRAKIERKYQRIFYIDTMMSSKESLEDIYHQIDVHETVILYQVQADKRMKLMEYCTSNQKQFYITPRVEDIAIQGFGARILIDTPILQFEYHYLDPVKNAIKRIADIVFSLFFLILFSPILIVTAIAIKAEDGGPVFFLQDRCTIDNKVFKIIKFRSMHVNADKPGEVNPFRQGGDPRVTKVGNIIRRYRIDEMPQFFNVLRGDMSIVGPRPERVEHVMKYIQSTPEFAYRSRVKAGLTGLGQIYGKYNTTAYDKALWDLEYIDNQSLLLDAEIILLTVKVMFTPESTEGFEQEKKTEETSADSAQSPNAESRS